MKILYVSQYFPPEMGAPAARVAELSRYWAEERHEVTVLTGFPNHPTGIVPAEYRRKLRRLVAREKIERSECRPYLAAAVSQSQDVRAHVELQLVLLFSGRHGLFTERPDVVIASSPQLLVGLSGWWLARCKRSRFIFEVAICGRSRWRRWAWGRTDSLVYRALARIAGFLYRNSDHIVVVTPAFKEYLVQHMRVRPEKISVIENGVEVELFSPKAESDLRSRLGADGKFVVSYIGTMGNAHGFQTLIEAAAQLQNSAPEVLFLLVGEGRRRNNWCLWFGPAASPICALWISNRGRRYQPIFARRTSCVVLLKKSEIFKTVIPSKMLEFMSCGRPVILGVEGQARHILEEAQAGVCIEPGNSQELTGRFYASPGMRNCGKPWVAMDAAMFCSTFHAATPRWRISTC